MDQHVEREGPDRLQETPPAAGAFRRALILTAPAAIGAVTVGLTALSGAEGARLAIGVALGAALGAAAASWLVGVRVKVVREAAPPAPPALTPIEERSEAAEQAAALIAGPSASFSQALCDARLILETLPAALLILNARGQVMFANAQAEQETGRRLHGEPFAAALRAPALVEAVKESFDGRAAADIEFTLHRRQERHYRASVRALPGDALGAAAAEGEAIYGQARVVIVLQDQTRARRTEQLHRDFIANASHELKTPLSSIGGFVETLRGAARDDPAAQERFLGILAQQAERMRRLVEDLLSLNRIELNEHVPPRETVDLIAIARRAAAETPGHQQERLILELPDDPAWVRGDGAQLEQVISNLIENALKYGGEGREVRVSHQERTAPRRRIGLAVQDFGPGVAKEHLPRLTERFYRVEQRRDALKSGTGLGLSIVKHAVSRHRGRLEIESRLGHGSRFTVWLPPDDAFDGVPTPSAEEAVDPPPRETSAGPAL
ncbi:MAG: ATP-binding protein [Pseudomonadota bacterium]